MTAILSRFDVGLPGRVTNIDRITPRPLRRPRLGMVIAHYTGVKRSYANADLTKTIASIHRWRANEYNYVIHADGRIAEFAGAYQAAHCAGRNATSYGVLFLNGVNDPCTDAQVASFRWLVDVLKWTQAVAPGVRIVQHGQVAATACPGRVKERWAELVA
jgi:N-acetyl-anhydromuramyl-L-alanine amidase AmpD